ncbi:MAG: MBL fold metallo-hydrolase [archaeon]|nr:MBL fold metallo-hydrolase [archaeon]
MENYTVNNVTVSRPGHATVMIVTEDIVIYIDPYILPKDAPKADLIFITHEHYDHCAPEKIREISDENTKIIAAKGCASKIGGNVTLVSAGDSIIMDTISINAVDAYNIGKPFHPRELGVGYVIDIAGVKIYHAGDTDRIPEMKDLKDETIDIAFLPVGGTYTMDVEEASLAASDIMPKVVIPIHYGYIDGTDADIARFRNLMEHNAQGVEVRVI